MEWVDYKDVALLRKYMSDRGKIRARRVSGNCTQHQRDIAIAIKTARELVLLPYTQRTTTERPGGRGGRGGGGGFAGGGGRRGRDEERTLGEEGASTAIPDGTPPLDGSADVVTDVVEVLEVDVVELDNGDELVIVEAVEVVEADDAAEAGGE